MLEEKDDPKPDERFLQRSKSSEEFVICTQCHRNINAPLFDGCMNRGCPHGFEPCF